jgi:uncharacterized membrane protein YhaH (DUF805 family)
MNAEAIHKIISWRGRYGRISWWLSFAFIWLMIRFAEAALIRGSTYHDMGAYTVSIATSAFGIWVAITASCKRLHDLGRSGWWQIFGCIPLAGQIGLMVWLGFLRGVTGANRYGEPPSKWWTRRVEEAAKPLREDDSPGA